MIRADVTIDWESSPRIILVDAPSTEITMQDLVDTLRYRESLPSNIDNPSIVSASGKEPLGGGVLVGLTVTLLNAKIGFEPRLGPEYIVCDAGGGNLVAFDAAGQEMNPIYPTAFTQIVKTSSASATLSDLDAIQYSSYQNAVWYKSTSDNSGVDFPSGTREHPCNNLADCLAIAHLKGFDIIKFLEDVVIDSGLDYSNLRLIGQNAVLTTITVSDAANVTNCEFQSATLRGVLDGGSIVDDCIIDGIEYINGIIKNCTITSSLITLGGATTAMFLNCSSATPGTDNVPTIDFGTSGTPLAIRGWIGGMKLANKIDAANCSIDITSGQIIVENSCVAGIINVRGIAELTDNSGPGCLVDYTGLIDPNYIQHATYNDTVFIDQTNGTTGTTYPKGTSNYPCNNIADAIAIANIRGITRISLLGNLTLASGDDVSRFTIYGEGAAINTPKTSVVMEAGCITANTEWHNCYVSGVQGGEGIYFNCVINEVADMHCFLEHCLLFGPSTLKSGAWTATHKSYYNSCHTYGEVTINYNGSGVQQRHIDAAGDYLFTNMTNPAAKVFMGLSQGSVTLDASCTEGTIILSGIGCLYDNSGPNVTVDTSCLINPDDISKTTKSVFNKRSWDKDANTITIYADDGVTPLYVFDTNEDMSEITPQ